MPNPEATQSNKLSLDDALSAVAAPQKVSLDDALGAVTAKPSNQGTAIAATDIALPTAARIAGEVATNPVIPRVAATAGRIIGGAAPIVGGGSAYGLPGAAVGVAGAAKGAWLGGRTGWFTGKLLQNVSTPVAEWLGALSPYAQMVATPLASMSAEGSALDRLNASIAARAQQLRSQGKSMSESIRQAYNEHIQGK